MHCAQIPPFCPQPPPKIRSTPLLFLPLSHCLLPHFQHFHMLSVGAGHAPVRIRLTTNTRCKMSEEASSLWPEAQLYV